MSSLRNVLIAHVRAATPIESDSRSAWVIVWLVGSLVPWLAIAWMVLS